MLGKRMNCVMGKRMNCVLGKRMNCVVGKRMNCVVWKSVNWGPPWSPMAGVCSVCVFSPSPTCLHDRTESA